MGKTKSKSKSKKKKSASKTNKKLNVRLLVVILAVSLLLCIGLSVFLIVKSNAKKRLSVAFFDLPSGVVMSIEEQISSLFDKEILFSEFGPEDFDAQKIAKKYDLFFAWDGSVVQTLKKSAYEIPSACYSALPTAIRREDLKTLPVLLNHFEVAYYKQALSSASLDLPKNFMEFQGCVAALKTKVFSPFFCAGGDDETLISLVTAITEALGGSKAVFDLTASLQKKYSLKEIIDLPLSPTARAQDEFSVRNVLDMLRGWQQNELVHPGWIQASVTDIQNFMEDNQLGVVFMPLSAHRQIPYEQIKKFEADRMPFFSTGMEHGLVAPSVVCLKLTPDSAFDNALINLVSENVQSTLSIKTRLAPVSSRGGANDRQSDDVRFWAASCKSGQLSGLYNSLYQTNKNGAHKFAEEIRGYLRTGVL